MFSRPWTTTLSWCLDSHWATTVEFVITSAAERSGLFTSEELPRGNDPKCPYGFKGDPELAAAIAKQDEKNGTWITPISDPHLPIFYATLNLWHYLGRGLGRKKVDFNVCLSGPQPQKTLRRAGRALGRGDPRDRPQGSDSRFGCAVAYFPQAS